MKDDKATPKAFVSALAVDTGKARDFAGKAMGVSGRLVQDAKKVLEKDPELEKEVRQGALLLNKAIREVRSKEKETSPTPPTLLPHAIDASAYEVIIADPPPSKLALETESPRAVADNAILFLHTDSKHLDLALQRIVQWGFMYQDAITWIADQPIQTTSISSTQDV